MSISVVVFVSYGQTTSIFGAIVIQNNESAIAGRTGTIYIDAVSGFVVNN